MCMLDAQELKVGRAQVLCKATGLKEITEGGTVDRAKA